MKKITKYEIINHGIYHSQYFPGCGTYGTDYDQVFTGIGENAKEAYENALDIIATDDYDTESLPSKPRGIRKDNKVSTRLLDLNFHWFVSIMIKG